MPQARPARLLVGLGLVAIAASKAGAAPILQIGRGQESNDFGRLTTGTESDAITIGLRVPVGGDPLTLTTLASDNPAFLVDDKATQRQLAVGSTTTFDVRFHPARGGASTATVRISAAGVAQPLASVLFRGEAVDPDVRIVPVSGSGPPFDFGVVSLGRTSVPRQLRVENRGPLALSIASVRAEDKQFLVDLIDAGGLPPSGSATVFVTFVPTSVGLVRQDLTLGLTGIAGPGASAALSGIGVDEAGGCSLARRHGERSIPWMSLGWLPLLLLRRRRHRR